MEFQFLGAPGIKSRLSFWSTESESMREVILGSGWQYRVAAAAHRRRQCSVPRVAHTERRRSKDRGEVQK
jgi:hypothetical protein